ncbi:hypothetical protein [Moheibacter lacus]|uniref:Lipocalin-like domain-containing protein n=1 Tax=Moheibacter lacus TaxID=2745851 RepID=A0A838ZQV2_9FLAO|nr:hypothetical protein [Moheibacter lacus]MBA5628303.1 hypothetical protein [Moheibacter lacus]
MKKVFAMLFALSLGLGMLSCSSDDDGGDGPNYSVVGRWEITNYTVNGTVVEECSNNGTRQFRTDGSYLQDEFIEDENGVCTETLNSPVIGSYTKSGDNLNVTISGTTKNYDIEFTSETRFTLTEEFNNVDFVYTYVKVN